MESLVAIVAGVVGFAAIILALVLVLLIARSRLLPSGKLHVTVNDDPANRLTVPAGSTLLEGLTTVNVFLSSACGGKGTCGACKVRVTAGGGAPLPTETSLLSRAEANHGVRLACQLRMREDLSIELPPETFGASRWECTVRTNHNVATFIKELVLDLPPHASVQFRAGGYMQLEAPPYQTRYRDFDIDQKFRDAWERHGMWHYTSKVQDTTQRAYSMANHPGEEGVLIFNVRIASPPAHQPDAPPGIVSSYLFGLRPGDKLMVYGPYGEFYAKDTDAEMMFIGGGAGMAPLRSHIFDQLVGKNSHRRISFWYGARSLQESFYVDEFNQLAANHNNFQWTLALSDPLPEDHWRGATGFIHKVAYEQYLSKQPNPEDIEFYLCGPPPMIDACLEMLANLGVDANNILFDKFS